MARVQGVLAAHIDIPPELAGSLVVLVISLVIVLSVWMVRGGHGGKQTRGTVPRPGAPTCPCGYQAKWTVPHGPWHCDRCNVPVHPHALVQPQPLQPPLQHAPQAPFCGTCGGPGRWIPASNAWGCDHCRQLIQPRA
ncbi:MAG: hypothetical protein SFX73_19785 [Kofleriaceae bacterium]|nr:hypothetical protein [Kofleriaceae bacterium]